MANVPSGIGALSPGGYGVPASLGAAGSTNIGALAPLPVNGVMGGPASDSRTITATPSAAPLSSVAPVAQRASDAGQLSALLNLINPSSATTAPVAINYMPGLGMGITATGSPVNSTPLPRSGGKGAIASDAWEMGNGYRY